MLACLTIACLIAVRLTRGIDENLPAFERLVGRTLPVIALAVAGLIGFSPGSHRFASAGQRLLRLGFAAGQKAPNVLLVVLDTVRADHLGLLRL